MRWAAGLLVGLVLVTAPVAAQEAVDATPSPFPTAAGEGEQASVGPPLAPEAQVTAADPEAAADVIAEPTVAEPTVAEPTVAEPTVAEPTVAEPTVAEPTAEPADAPWAPPGSTDDHGSVLGNPDAEPGVLADIAADGTPSSALGLLRNLLIDPVQPVAWNHYDVGASVGFTDRLYTHLARLVFSLGLWVMAFASWLLGFVLRFDLGHLLAGDAGRVAAGYASVLTDGPGVVIGQLMLILAIGHAGWQMLRNRGQAALAELLVAVVIALVGTYLVHDADRAGCAGLRVMAATTIAMIELAQPDGGTTGEPYDFCAEGAGLREGPAHDTTLVFEDRLLRTFVHEPYLLVQWGQVPAPGTTCRRVADALVARGSWGDHDAPRQHMGNAGCQPLADFNTEMTAERVAGASTYALAAAAFAAAVVLTAGTLLAAQVAGALLVVTMPFAVVLGISPGAGRQLLARWVHGVLKVGVLFVGSGFFLTLMTTAVSAVQGDGGDRNLFIRMLSSIVVAWSLVVLRGKVFSSLRQAAATTAQGLAPGADVGGPGRGPASWVGGRVVHLGADAAMLHQGAVGVAAAAGAVGGAATTAPAGVGLAAVGRAARLRSVGGGGP